MAHTCYCGPIEHKITEERRKEIKKVGRRYEGELLSLVVRPASWLPSRTVTRRAYWLLVAACRAMPN